MTTTSEDEVAQPLQGTRVAFVGKLGGLTRREAQRLVRRHGGVPVDPKPVDAVDLIVIGADELPLGEQMELLDEAARLAAAEGKLQVITETQLWQRLGLVEHQHNVHRLHTPAMLADLLGVSVSIVRRWHRRGLIVPVREVHRLPYFDFQEVATARRLAQLLAAGASPAAIEKKLAALARLVPDVERPLAQLSAIVEGRQILLRQGEGLIEPGGQLRIDFDAIEQDEAQSREAAAGGDEKILSLGTEPTEPVLFTEPDEMLRCAAEMEDLGELEAAANMYRAALSAAGPSADVCFRLAEVLYRLSDLNAARERYYMAIELDEDFVEARANLGCVLAETGQCDLAVAAFQGALELHSDYPDVHYHLARTFCDLGQVEAAEEHWRTFLALAADSPWAEEARARLADLQP